jgi:hypothetical protein
MARAAGVPTLGTAGTTAGIGELIQDALDEGAFSIVLGHEEALARDAGLGAAQALGVCFFDVSGNPLDLAKPSVSLEAIARIDASNRSFSLLSSRIFIARSRSVAAVPDSSELNRLREIVQRDLGVRPPMVPQSASAIEFGLTALLGAEVRDGVSLILEASGISEAVRRKEFSYAIFFIEQENEGQALTEFLELCRECIPQRAMLSTSFPSEQEARRGESTHALSDVALFQPPVTEHSGLEEKRRNFTMRLEKLIPTIMEGFSTSARKTSGRHA